MIQDALALFAREWSHMRSPWGRHNLFIIIGMIVMIVIIVILVIINIAIMFNDNTIAVVETHAGTLGTSSSSEPSL